MFARGNSKSQYSLKIFERWAKALETCKCETCLHNLVCMHSKEFRNTLGDINRLNISDKFVVELKCKMYSPAIERPRTNGKEI